VEECNPKRTSFCWFSFPKKPGLSFSNLVFSEIAHYFFVLIITVEVMSSSFFLKVVAAPSATRIMVDMGAEVVKIEEPKVLHNKIK